ncbi:MAG: hypothetical protein ACOYU3_05885 [Bacillota bacterium]
MYDYNIGSVIVEGFPVTEMIAKKKPVVIFNGRNEYFAKRIIQQALCTICTPGEVLRNLREGEEQKGLGFK